MGYHELEMTLVRQVQDNDCWICCAVMIHNYYVRKGKPTDKLIYNKNHTPEKIQQYLRETGRTTNTPGPASDLLVYLDGFAVPIDEHPLPGFGEIQDAIGDGVPLLCLVKDTETGENHWIVLMGWSDAGELIFLDPGEKKKVISDLDSSKEAAQEVMEALKTLMELANMHMEGYYDKLMANLEEGKMDVHGKEQLKVPITFTTREYKEVHVITQQSTSDILGKVAESITEMVDDKSATGIINGIASIATDALNTILGAGKGMEQSVECYAVTVDYPAIVRYDFSFWGRNIEAEGIRKYCQSAVACVAVKSAVDCKALAFNDFLAVAAPVFARGFAENPDQMAAAIAKAKEIYNMYKTDEISPPANSIAPANQLLRAKQLPQMEKIDLSQYSTQPLMVVHPPVRATQGNF